MRNAISEYCEEVEKQLKHQVRRSFLVVQDGGGVARSGQGRSGAVDSVRLQG